MKEQIRAKVNQINFFLMDGKKQIQKICLWIALFVVYFLGIGFTWLLTVFVGRRFLRSFRIKSGQLSYWEDAVNYHHEDLSRYEQQV